MTLGKVRITKIDVGEMEDAISILRDLGFAVYVELIIIPRTAKMQKLFLSFGGMRMTLYLDIFCIITLAILTC